MQTHLVGRDTYVRTTQACGKSARFGNSAGIVEGVAAALQIPITLVPPAAWKKSQGLVGKGKDAAHTRAAQIYPGERRFDLKGKGQALADAVFIARHGAGIRHAQ
ncbi:hypothetical protein dqs_2028 [Azoarcus olearius]|uniref:hypothetical protein n=1 Tax=Azoarcus sp. (strain BH72) TaxID=418699 RepID=UPI0008062316|nr:hypothetical protein [Azoarcus olearius]ANQ85065.1 hypothetical protein dqs_2028 [Azoarcus olearius]